MVGEAAAVGAALVWAVSSLLLKPLSTRFHPLALQGLRCLTAALFFGSLLLITRKTDLMAEVSPWRGVGLALGTFIGVGIGESLFVLGLRYMDVSQAYPISICGYPLVTILLASLFLHENMGWSALAGSGIVIAGVYLIASPKQSSLLSPLHLSSREKTGLWLICLTIVFWGVGAVVIKANLETADLLIANFLRFSAVTFLLLPLTLRYWDKSPAKGTKRPLLIIGALSGLLSFGIGGFLFLTGMRYAGVAKASVLSSTSPVFLVPLAMVFLQERVTLKLLAGVALSIMGIGLVVS